MTKNKKKTVKKDEVKELLEHIDKINQDMLEILKLSREINNPTPPPPNLPSSPYKCPDDTPFVPPYPPWYPPYYVSSPVGTTWIKTPDGIRWYNGK